GLSRLHGRARPRPKRVDTHRISIPLIQIPSVPSADSLQIEVPLPGAFERWRDLYLVSGVEKLFVFLLFALLFYFLARLAKRFVGEQIEDINRRHVLRKLITYMQVVLLLLVAVALFADWLTGLGTILALLIAGVAVALQ